jgi:hypothetical protein
LAPVTNVFGMINNTRIAVCRVLRRLKKRKMEETLMAREKSSAKLSWPKP